MLKNAARNGPMIGWDLMRESNLESGSYVLFVGQLTAFFGMELSRIFPFVISQVLYFRAEEKGLSSFGRFSERPERRCSRTASFYGRILTITK